MNDVAYALTIGLALVFAWAGVAKLRSPRETARSFRALGVPPSLARVVPFVELALAALVLVEPLACVAAIVLLGLFTIVLVGADDGVRCACFGSASTEPVSWVQIVRNGMLAAIAAVGSGASPVMPSLAAGLTVIGIAALCLLGLALADLKHRTGAVLRLDLP